MSSCLENLGFPVEESSRKFSNRMKSIRNNGILLIDKPHSIIFPFLLCELMVGDARAKDTDKYRVDIYIGSDNNSREISDIYLEKVRQWANETFPDGYTIVRGEGYYNGISEDSILLYAFLTYDIALKHRLERLKRGLRQESILFVKSAVDFEVV